MVKVYYLIKWILKNKKSNIAIFGFGKDAKRVINMFLSRGIKISKIFSWKKGKTKDYRGIPVYNFNCLPTPGKTFFIVFVGSIELANYYEKFFTHKGYKPLKDFILCG